MSYNSKYTGTQVEALLDKAGTSIQVNNIKTVDGISIIGTGDIAITSNNKGYFATEIELNEHYPNANPGSIAYVGTVYPYNIYKWDNATLSWINTGETGGSESVNLNNYTTKEDVRNIFSEMFVAVGSEEELREMLEYGGYDENKIYYVIEE